MAPDIISEIFNNVGMNVPIRNFLVDYSNAKEDSFFKPLQTVCIVDYTDNEIVDGIIQDMKKEQMTVNAITEVYGEHSLKELSIIGTNTELLLKTGFKYLYLKNKKCH